MKCVTNFQKISSWNKMWLALKDTKPEDFLTPKERVQEIPLRDPFEKLNNDLYDECQ